MKRLSALALRAVGVAALLTLLVVALAGDPHPVQPGTPAPIVRGTTLDGAPFEIASLDDKPLLVNIWATWCRPCMHEMPVLEDIKRRYEGRLGVVGLAAESEVVEIRRVIERLHLTYPIARIDAAGQRLWNADAFPSTYLIGRDGRIAWSMRGAVRQEELEAQILPLLAP